MRRDSSRFVEAISKLCGGILNPCLIQVMSKKLPHNMENVCLSTDEEANMYAVGSKGSTDLLDARTLQVMNEWTQIALDFRLTLTQIFPVRL